MTALTSLTVTATEGYTTMKDLTRLPTRELLASRMDAHVTTQSRALYSPQPTCTRSRNPSRIPSERQGTKLRGNSMHHSLHVGLTLEVTLLGKRANYTLRAEVIGLDSAIAQLRTATGQTLNVPLEAIADVKRIDVRTPPRSPELSQKSRASSHTTLIRGLQAVLDAARTEPDALTRVDSVAVELSRDVHAPSMVNAPHVQTILIATEAVRQQLGQREYVEGLNYYDRAVEAIRHAEAELAQQNSRSPLAKTLKSVLDGLTHEHASHWQELSRRALQPPRILTKDRVNVSRGHDHEFDLPIRVSLDAQAAPLRDVSVVLDKFRSLSIVGATPTIDTLQAGQTTTAKVRLRDNRKQGARSEIRLDAHLRYRTPDGLVKDSTRQTLVLNIQAYKSPEEIPNPFRQYAGGLPVSSPDMFFGREKLIRELVRELSKTPGGTCFALYGQQRTGKSSVLEQVRQQLISRQAIVAALSMGTMDRNSMTVNFIEEILDQFRVQIDRFLASDTSRLLLDRWPDSTAIEKRPLRSFQRALEAARSLLRTAGKTGVPFVVVVDEFTYIHEVLRRRGINPGEHNELRDFMRQLKGLLEARFFSALLIGQDTMPRFLDSYPNEFSVMSTRKLDYLTVDEAQELADLPVKTTEGRSRYSGYALNAIASYTDGHPFFTQILCDRVITLVNSRHRSEVTENDVEEAVESLLSGRDCIEAHKFDCLVTADNTRSLVSETEDDSQPDGTQRALIVLRRIASLSGSQNGMVPSAELQLDVRQEEALRDLILRGVVHQKDSDVSIRVLLYADYLRRNQK